MVQQACCSGGPGDEQREANSSCDSLSAESDTVWTDPHTRSWRKSPPTGILEYGT
jgi:hypothetical protein